MKKTYFITMPAGEDRRPIPIAEETWTAIISDVETIISKDFCPIPIGGQNHAGTALVDTNVISFSPVDNSKGGNFVLKRVGNKLMTRVKSYSDEYDSVIAAVLLVLKSLVPDIEVTCTAGEAGFVAGIRYYEYITEVNAPVVYPSQARRVIIEFSWTDDTTPQRCAELLQELRENLAGRSQDILQWNIRFE